MIEASGLALHCSALLWLFLFLFILVGLVSSREEKGINSRECLLMKTGSVFEVVVGVLLIDLINQ